MRQRFFEQPILNSPHEVPFFHQAVDRYSGQV
jgi:hypothetical protein